MSVRNRTAAIVGIVGCVLFWASLFVFGEMRSDYSQHTKAVSELGVFGAPHALMWNLIGFITPGLCLAVCGGAVARALEPSQSSRACFWLLVASGLGFAATGVIPAEMHAGSPLLESPYTVGHIVMTFVSAIPWILATFLLVGPMRRTVDWRVLSNVSLALGVLAIASFSLRATTISPAIAQRVAFAVYFAWFLIMSIRLLSVGTRPHQAAA